MVAPLAVPQATHYVLTGFIWRRYSHEDVIAITPSADIAGPGTLCLSVSLIGEIGVRGFSVMTALASADRQP